MKDISIWERYNEKREQWEHNHITEGYDASVTEPKPDSKEQQRSWPNAKWRLVKGTMDADGNVQAGKD